MTAGEAIALTGAVFVLGFCFGCLFTLARKPPRPVVVIRREPMQGAWCGDFYERFDQTSEQQAEQYDRIAALKREVATLRGLLCDKRLDEISERRLRVVEG